MNNVKPLTPKQEDRRRRILSAARRMVADYGYDGMVMSEVAESAGVSPTTLYNLYNTKDELLLEALRDLLVENYQQLDAQVPAERGWQYLHRVVQNGALLRHSEPAYGEAIVNALLRSVPGDALTQLLLENVRQDFQFSLEQMAERGELTEYVDIEHLSVLLLGNYWSTFLLVSKGAERLSRIKLSLEINMLSVLLASTHGETRQAIEHKLEDVRAAAEELPSD